MTAVAVPLVVVWAYTVAELHVLAHRRGRRGARSTALRARAALIIGMLFAVAAVAALVVAGTVADGAAADSTAYMWRAPLLLVPAAAAVRRTLPRLGRLIQRLYADPWGPSDPPIRQAAVHPAVVVPAQSALLGALIAGFATTWATGAASYVFAAAATAGMALDARRRRARLERLRAGTLPRVLHGPRAHRPPGGEPFDVLATPILPAHLMVGTGDGMERDWRHGMYQGPDLVVQGAP
jgi:hypothetical protein